MPAARTAPVNWGEWPAWIDKTTETPACRGHDTDLFFPEQRTPEFWKRIAEAKRVCAVCPLLEQCRGWAYAQPWQALAGIWGGTTQSERRQRAAVLRDAGEE